MTLDQFVSKYEGKHVEFHSFDKRAINQCVDLANAYITEVLGLPGIIGTNAIDFPKKAVNHYLVIPNTPTGVPEKGDLVIFKSKDKVGHISIFLEGNTSLFTSFDQNYPTGSVCKKVRHNYTNVVCWMHPISSTQETMPEAEQFLKTFNIKDFKEATFKWNEDRTFLEEERKKTTELQSINKDHQTHLEELATKLNTTADYPAILAEVTHLLSVEEINRTLEKKLSAEETKHDQERNELVDRVNELQRANERINEELEVIKTKLVTLEVQEAFITRLQNIIKSIFRR